MTSVEEATANFQMAAAQPRYTLWEYREEWLSLLDLLEDPEVDQHLVEQELEKLGERIAHKAEGIAGLVRDFERLAEMRRAEGKRLVDSAARLESRAEWLRGYVLREMRAIGAERIDTGRYTLKIRLNPPRVEVLEAMLVPHEFQREKKEIETDKVAIKEHWKATGEVVPGVEIVRTERLVIE